MQTIAVIDDDAYIGDMLRDVLTREGYGVLRAYSGTEALLLLAQQKPDLILLDLMLPGLSGEEVLKRIKGIPVIVISAKADIQDRVDLLIGGAADYLTKPFDVQELLARVTVQLRKMTYAEAREEYVYHTLTLNCATREATAGAVAVKLTRTEFAILKTLMQNPEQVLSKAMLLNRISDDTPDCVESSLKVHVSNLRRKLRDACGREMIQAVWGIGFTLNESK